MQSVDRRYSRHVVTTRRSKPIAATIGTFFGGLWAYVAAMESAPGWQTPLALLTAVATLLLITRLWWMQPPECMANERLFGRRPYLVAVVLEIAAIYVASILLPRLGLQAFFLQAVGIIVGLHFLGLWSATGSRRFIGIAVVMCAVSGVAILLPQTFHLVHLRDAATGLGNAWVLWVGASEGWPGAADGAGSDQQIRKGR